MAILCGNGAFSAQTILGAMAAGAVAVPLSWRWSAAELEHGINDSRAKVLLADTEHAPAAHHLIEAGRASAEQIAAAVEVMTTLNRAASEASRGSC